MGPPPRTNKCLLARRGLFLAACVLAAIFASCLLVMVAGEEEEIEVLDIVRFDEEDEQPTGAPNGTTGGPKPEAAAEGHAASRGIWPSTWFSKWHKCGMAPLNPIGGREPKESRSGFSSAIAANSSAAAAAAGASRMVVNGTEQSHGEWPFFVVLRDKVGELACGGTLISDRHVLTAAHCGQGIIEQNIEDFEAVFADHRLNRFDGVDFTRKIKSICVADGYSHSGGKGNYHLVNDWAVIELAKAIQPFSDYVQHACLPMNAQENPSTRIDNPATKCYLVGIGAQGGERSPPTQKYVPPGPQPPDGPAGPQFLGKRKKGTKREEWSYHKWNNHGTISKLEMGEVDCGGWNIPASDASRSCYKGLRKNSDSCSGDSGGPILCYRPDGDQWYVMAIVSYGSELCDEDSGQEPWVAVHADISKVVWHMLRKCPRVHQAITNHPPDDDQLGEPNPTGR